MSMDDERWVTDDSIREGIEAASRGETVNVTDRIKALAAEHDTSPNTLTEPAPATGEHEATEGAAEGTRALQRRNVDRLARLKAQGVEIPAPVLVDLKLQALVMILSKAKVIEDEAFNSLCELLMDDLLSTIEGQLNKAKLTQGIKSNLRLK